MKGLRNIDANKILGQLLSGGAATGVAGALAGGMLASKRGRKLGKKAEIHVYPGAGHAFANPSGENYLEGPAEEAWARTLAFFAAHLR